VSVPRWVLWAALVVVVLLAVALVLSTGPTPSSLAVMTAGAALAEGARRSRASARADLEQLAEEVQADANTRAGVEAAMADAGGIDEVPLKDLVEQEHERGRG